MIDDPKLRTFHIDTECYIVYLGSGPDDYRPFLRIGNSPKLPEKVKHFISAVVVSDTLTGNQLIEHENLELPLNGETRYIGDPVEVNKLKQFLDEKDLPVEGYEYEESEDILKKGGAFVYFYKSGNLHIVHNAQGIFDLQTRERDDGHFICRVERVVQAVKSNPFRYLPRDLSSPGFLTAGGRLYFFRDGRLGTVGITPDHIVDLGRYGIDPDLLMWLVEDRLSEGLLNRFKRATVTKKDIRVATSELPRLQSAVSLFTESGLSCIVAHLEAGESKVFSGYTIERRAAGVSVSFPDGTGFPEVLFSSAVNADIPNSMKDFLKKLGFKGKDYYPISGVPYLILDRDERDSQSLIRAYLRNMIEELKDVVSPVDGDFLKYFEVLVQAVQAPEGNSGANALYDGKSKKISAPRSPELEFVYWNVQELSRLGSRRKGVPAGVKKHGLRLGAIIPPPKMPEANETKLPVMGEFVRFDGEWFLFYRWNGMLTKLKLLQAQKSLEIIEKLRSSYDEKYYDLERERLLRFIEGLSDVPGKKRRKVPIESVKASAKTGPVESGGTSEIGSAGKAGAAETRSAPTAGSSSGSSAAEGKASGSSGKDTPAATADRISRKTGSAVSASNSTGPGPSFPAPGPDEFSGPFLGGKSGGGKGKAAFIVLAVLAAGGGLFLILRSCDDPKPMDSAGAKTESKAESISAMQPSAQPSTTTETSPGIPPRPPTEVFPRDPFSPEKPQSPGGTEQRSGEIPAAEGPKPPPTDKRPDLEPLRADTVPSGRDAMAASSSEPAIMPRGDSGTSTSRAAVPETVPSSVPGLDPEKIPITILDVFYLVNTIAADNGYRPLDEPKDVRPDPNWIYPGNSFKLPDAGVHTVMSGDTLWDISILYIRKSIRRQTAEYNAIMGPFRGQTVPPEKKEQTAAVLRTLRDACISEKLRDIFSKTLREIGN
jgi:hypothetical protein